ncbi:MAG TPA: hypothetical protein PKN32_11540 [Bacteroidales bacterium]|nr:hypothetical protein [Bacteroidales bacterium]
MIYVLVGIVAILVILHFATKKKKKNIILNNEKLKASVSCEKIDGTDVITVTYSKEAGMVDGKHYTEYISEIKELKRQNKLDDAEKILLKIIKVLEEEAKIEGEDWFIAPAYFEELAIIYRKQDKISDEIKILEHYFKLSKMTGNGKFFLEERYRKAKLKLESKGKF